MFNIVLSYKEFFIFATTCPIEMGFGSKCSIFTGQVICIEKSKLNFADMWLIPLDRVTFVVLWNSPIRNFFSNPISLLCQRIVTLLSCVTSSRNSTACAPVPTLSGLTPDLLFATLIVSPYPTFFRLTLSIQNVFLSIYSHPVELPSGGCRQVHLLASFQSCCLPPPLVARFPMFLSFGLLLFPHFHLFILLFLFV